MKKNNKGFTLAELLIVVAIIAVLVAIAIPVFTTQLERSREATDLANIRSAYAEAVADYLANGANKASNSLGVSIKQQTAGWLIDDGDPKLYTRVDGVETPISLKTSIGSVKAGDTVYVHVDATGKVTIDTSATASGGGSEDGGGG